MRPLPALIVTVLVWASGAGAVARAAEASPPPDLDKLVILLRPPSIDELTREALSRITGELAAARFRVIIFPLDTGVDPIEQVETVGRDLDPVAAFALVRGTAASAGSVDLWVSDRLAQRTTIQRMHVQDGDVSRAAEVLAVESVEQIRVSMADLWPRPVPAPAAPRAAPSADAEPARASLGLGMGVLQDFRSGSPNPQWAPVARLAYGRPGGFALALALSGLGPASDLVEDAGTAQVRRATGWLAVVRSFRPGRVLQPFLSLGGGVDYLRAQGSAPDPTRAHTRLSWSALAAVGGGLAVAVAPHVALVLEVEGMMFWPPVVVRIGGQDAAPFDHPSVLVDAGLHATF
jgi:hypothetical protein